MAAFVVGEISHTFIAMTCSVLSSSLMALVALGQIFLLMAAGRLFEIDPSIRYSATFDVVFSAILFGLVALAVCLFTAHSIQVRATQRWAVRAHARTHHDCAAAC